jgi:hypothetical protein
MKRRMMLAALTALTCAVAVAVVASAGAHSGDERRHRGSDYEVWLIDQQDTRADGGGVLHVFDGDELDRDPADAQPEVVDLGGAARDLCIERTGSAPRRPHMVVFNGGDDDGPGGNEVAALAWVVSGHVLFMEADTREPIECIDVGTQAHAAWPTPDQEHLIVANQNGKRLHRIRTDYDRREFTLETGADIDLANCTTPSGARCEDPVLRPDNAPICPRTDSRGRFTFVSLRGGGAFVVDHNATPMRIVAEYDRDHVDDNGCGQMEARGKMYLNAGAGAPGDLQGHDVYAIELDRLSTTPLPPNTPQAELVYSRDDEGEVDAHAVALTKHGRLLWWGDRAKNDVTVVDPKRDRVVNRFSLVGAASDDPAPDLFDLHPKGKLMFASLRGPQPQSGGHDAIGSTPGLGVIDVRAGGRSGRLVAVAPVTGVLAVPDPHAVRVRTLR